MSQKLWIIVSGVQLSDGKLLVDPVSEQCNFTISTGNLMFTAPDSLFKEIENYKDPDFKATLKDSYPGNNTSLVITVPASTNWTNQWTSSIPSARVLALFPASTDKALVQIETDTQPSGPKRRLTLLVWHNGQLDLLQNHLVFAFFAEHVLAPTRRCAPQIIKVVILRWQTNGGHAWRQFDRICQKN